MSSRSIGPTELNTYHGQFSNKSSLATATAVTAAFLVIISLIVLTSSCLCLKLPHINVVNSVILPGVLPAGTGLLICIPLIIMSVKLSREKGTIRKAWIGKIGDVIQEKNVEGMSPEEKVNFIKSQLLPKTTSWIMSDRWYKQAILKEIKETYPKEQTARSKQQEEMVKALDQVTSDLHPKKKSKK